MAASFRTPCLLALLVVSALSPARAQVPTPTILTPPAGVQTNAGLGSSVAVDGAYTVVGAALDDTGGQDSGVVKVFNSTTGTLLFLLPNPTPALGDQFGLRVAISGTRVVVGAINDDTEATDAGSAYVYDLSSGTPTVPVLTLSKPSTAAGDRFGASVAIEGTRVVVGANRDDTGATDAGSAYVYELSGGTPTVPIFTLNNPAPTASAEFGTSVALDGTRVVVGAPKAGGGKVYAYDLGGGTPTVPVATLPTPPPSIGSVSRFGASVAISGTRIIAGAPEASEGDLNTGNAYVYDLTSGTPTVPVHTLFESPRSRNSLFGTSVALDGTRAVVGTSPFIASGKVYEYDLSSGTPTVPVHTLSNPGSPTTDDFGRSVALSGARLVVGSPSDDTLAANAGSAYGYDLASGTPTVPVATFNTPSPALGDTFGTSVAISGTLMVVGAPLEDTGQSNAGSAYVYDLSSGTPTMPVATLNNPSPATSGENFGMSVAISGMRVVVGAPNAGGGLVYAYDLSSGTPTVPIHTLNSPTGNDFGASVAISGTRVVVGDPRDDTGALDAGSAYVYDLSSGTPTVPVATLNNPGPSSTELFGISVAIEGMRVVVGGFPRLPRERVCI